MDDLNARKRAMEEGGFDEVAEIYSERVEMMNEDPLLNAYDIPFENKIRSGMQKYFDVMYDCEKLLLAYIQLKSAVSSDETMIATHEKDVIEALTQIESKGLSLEKIMSTKPYCNMFETADKDLNQMISDLKKIRNKEYTFDDNDASELSELHTYLKNNKTDIIKSYRKEDWTASECMAVPSENETSGYQFIEFESEEV